MSRGGSGLAVVFLLAFIVCVAATVVICMCGFGASMFSPVPEVTATP